MKTKEPKIKVIKQKSTKKELDNLWNLMDEIWRVLKDTGTCWINLGDTYNGNKTGNDDPKLNDAAKTLITEVSNMINDVRDRDQE